MRTHLPNGDVKETESIGYITDRDRFDQHLAEMVEKAGAEIRKDCKAESLLIPFTKGGNRGLSGVEVIEGSKRYSIEAKIIIGADILSLL